MSKILRVLSAIGLAAAPSLLAAQVVVGHTPETSPYRDITVSQRVTIFGGYFAVQQDEVGATPQSGPSFGIRYSIPVAGPANFYARFVRVNSHREAFNPTKLPDTRSLGTQNLGLYVADLGFDLDLTGRRTWHGMIPLVGFGLGVTSAPTSTKDDPYDFGTQFSFSVEGGIRINPTNSYEIRLNAKPTFYQNHYPTQYFATPTGGTPLLASTTARSGFRHAIDYSAGLSFPLFR